MKIEIELEEVEALRNQVISSQNHIEKLQEKLDSLDENELQRRAIDLSHRLFDKYMRCVFIKMGFKKWDEKSVRFNLAHHILQKSWWNDDEINVEIGATVTSKFSQAFMKIGINPKVIQDNEDFKL